MARVYNFSPGPAMLPAPVLERAREELRGWHSSGVSVMEMSHRGKDFIGIAEKAAADLRELLAIPDNYKVLFLAGAASGQFAAVPMNLWRGKTKVTYVSTGYWSEKAIAEARLFGEVQVAASGKASNFTTIPPRSQWNVDPDAAYLHYTANETIGGGRVPCRTGGGRIATGCRHVVQYPVAAGGGEAVWAHLWQCPKEHRAGRYGRGHRSWGPDRTGPFWYPFDLQLPAASRQRVDG